MAKVFACIKYFLILQIAYAKREGSENKSKMFSYPEAHLLVQLGITRPFHVPRALLPASWPTPWQNAVLSDGSSIHRKNYADSNETLTSEIEHWMDDTVGAFMYEQPTNSTCEYPECSNAPRYHLLDRSGYRNSDPNGPVFDPVHGIYHVMYQKHVSHDLPMVYGHWLSRDLVHWAQMPMAIINGLDVTRDSGKSTPYDNSAIFTGSAAVVPGFAPDGVKNGVLQIYPGICHPKTWGACKGYDPHGRGSVLAVAVPHDYANDPFLTNWTKPDYNPVITSIQRDPSEPWKTSSGEWRLRTYDGMEYGSASDSDMKVGRWYTVGLNPTFSEGECPSYYPLPAATPGFETEYDKLSKSGQFPNRVHKLSPWSPGPWGGKRDVVQIGTHTDGAHGEFSKFSATSGWEDLMNYSIMDAGLSYAAKDMAAPDGRRINFAWSSGRSNIMTLPQEVTFNPVMRQLEYAPARELKQLRGEQLAKWGRTSFHGQKSLGLPKWVGNTSEVKVVFELPSVATTFGVWVMGGGNNVAEGTYFAIYFTPGNASAPWNEFAVSGCPSAQRGSAPARLQRCSSMIRLAPSETTLQLNVFVDNGIAEAFWQVGRTHLTVETTVSEDASIWLDASVPMTALSTNVWAMRSIWVTKEEILATPRPSHA